MAIGVVAFLAQRPPPEVPLPPYAVAKVAEVSITARSVEVVMRQGADRLLQRERSNFGRCPGTMGCPSSTEMRPVPVFLVRDEGGAVHAFIGRDPRNSCALEWKAIAPRARPASQALKASVDATTGKRKQLAWHSGPDSASTQCYLTCLGELSEAWVRRPGARPPACASPQAQHTRSASFAARNVD